ncbi:MAG TPA: Wzz/FepE/Etk N-terminal domain-containing protein [candidate division Zixibacteria bacterium]|nr:Wzz/FepE/Etk N-terminal domain-containing protein [candidate division Zixibacteria bacterium]
MNESSPGNFLLLLETLARRSRFIILFVGLATLLAIIISLMLPKWYKATATLLPPKQVTVPVGGLGEFAEAVSVTSGLSLPVLVTPSDVYARMLKSRTIAEQIMKRFKLNDRYDIYNFDEAYEALMDNTDFRVTAEGLLTVSAEDKEPQMAADITNAFVEELDKVNREIASQRAKHNRDFVAGRLEQVKSELDSARSAFEQFQTKNRTVDFDQQTKMVTERAIDLKIKMAEIDLELEMTGQELSQDNPKILELQRKRRIISDQMEQLENQNPDNSYFSVPISKIPSLRGRYEMLYSQVRVNEALYELLLGQMEQAKIQVSENSPTISVLDPARVPTLRSRPQRTLIVVATFAFSLVAAVFGSATADYFARLRKQNPDQYKTVEMLLNSYLGWLPGIKKRSN